jgi:TonB family protein
MVFADHVEPLWLNTFVRRGNEWITLGDRRYLLQAGTYGEVQFGNRKFSIEKVINPCGGLTFEVHTESNELVRFRLNITAIGLEGEAEFPDRIARVGPMQRPPCSGRDLVLMRKEDAKYTELARRAQIQGEVILLLQIEPSGRVSAARALNGLGFGLDESAVEAVKHWEFKFKSAPSEVCEIQAIVPFRIP